MKANGQYILYNEPDSDGRKTIYIRYYKSGFAIKRSTGLKALPSEWDQQEGLFVPSSPAAKRQNRRLKYVLEITDRAIASLKYSSVNQIQDTLDNVFVRELAKGQRTDFLDYCTELISDRFVKGEYDVDKSNEGCAHIKAFRNFLKSRLDIYFVPITEFRSSMVDLFAARLRKDFVSEEMIYKMLAPISNGMQQALREGLVDDSIASEVAASCMMQRTSARADDTRKCLSQSDLTLLSEYRDFLDDGPMKDALDLFMLSAREFALSLGEMMVLRWADVDWENCRLRRPKYRTSSPSDVFLPIGKEAYSILSRWKGRHPNYVFGLIEDGVNANDSYLLKQLKVICGRKINKLLSDAASALDIDSSLTMQVARNTFAACSLARGGSLYVVSKALGHASTSVTATMYGKYIRQSETQEMEKMVNLF